MRVTATNDNDAHEQYAVQVATVKRRLPGNFVMPLQTGKWRFGVEGQFWFVGVVDVPDV